MEWSQNVGKIVRFHRKKSGLTQVRLADLAGIGKTAIFDIEKGKTGVRVDSLAKVLAVLNIAVEFESPLMAEFSTSEQEEKGSRDNEKS